MIEKDWLYDHYVIKQLSVDAILKLCNCGKTTIHRYLKKYNIEARTLTEARSVKNDNLRYLKDANWLYEQYVTAHKTPREIGKDLNCGATTVTRHLKQHNIELRDVSKAKLGDSLELLKNKDWLYEQYVTNKKTLDVLMNELDCSSTALVKYLDLYNIDRRTDYCVSTMEFELQEFLSSNNINHSPSNRKVIYPYELDVYIPDHNFGIELNGIYWHSLCSDNDTKKNRNRHLNKTNICIENNITLFHFTSYEWDNKKDIIQSMILNKCKLQKQRIFARNCIIDEVSKYDEQLFFNSNHLQGYTHSNNCIGLKYNGEYVCMMSFKTPRYGVGYDFEILRIASKLNVNVVGGVSKLFKNFIKYNQNKSIITYADRRYSEGNIYKILGFTFSHNSKIGYKWTKYGIAYNRMQFQKHKLKDKLDNYDETLTENLNMFNNKYRKLYDCGQAVYVYDIYG